MRQSRLYIVSASLLGLILLGVALLVLASSGDGTAPTPDPGATQTPQDTSGTPTAAPPEQDVESAETDTSLNVRVDACDGCQVVARTTGPGDAATYSATVSDGAAQFDLPTANTLGLALYLRGAGQEDSADNDRLVVLSVPGVDAGSAQTDQDVEGADSGNLCWAGTVLDVATVRLTHGGDANDPEPAWADPALPTIKGSVPLTSGAAPSTLEPRCG